MISFARWKWSFALFLFYAATAVGAYAQTFDSLVSFDTTDGAAPLGSLVQGFDGDLYGTTGDGGTFGNGTMFKITPDGMLKLVHSFGYTEGYYPIGSLVLGADHNFYGVTENGGSNSCVLGCGTIFRITPQGTLTTLHSFCSETAVCADGGIPWAGLIQGFDGKFYGTASGGIYDDGVVFSITSEGVFAILHSFHGEDGSSPRAGLIQAADGSFYGTTSGGGANLGGTIFTIAPSGKLRTLYSFCGYPSACLDGSGPRAALIQATDGDLYGTTYYGGDLSGSCYPPFDLGCGTVFKLTLGGTLTMLHAFDLTDGEGPIAALMQATDGNLYGTTSQGANFACLSGCGTLFEITPAGGTLTTLHVFNSSDGDEPYGGLFQATNGSFYGTTAAGGTYSVGTVFSLNAGLGPFVAFLHSYGKVGQTSDILGQGFTGTTSVSFNGSPASFSVVSASYIRATVPSGATTGYVTVATLSGALTSNVPFYVVP